MIVDDSTPIRMILRKMIEMNSKLVVIGEAKSAAEAEALMAKELPDVITLDINMPEVDGVTFLRKMMQEKPIPTIMISALNYLESGPVFEALELGAFDYMKKPAFEDLQHISGELHEKIIAAYTSKYVGRISKANNLASFKSPLVVSGKNLDDYILAIGASTGGTKALSDLLTQLPNTVPPIIITQHIPPVFSKAFAERLNQLCKFSVKEAEDGDVLKASQAFIAPGGRHMKVVYQNSKYIIKITDDEPVNRFRPSVDYMFNSLIQHDKLGKKVIALLLTGMGRDGAEGLLKLKELGAKTAAQDESSCVVYGMPKVAYELGAVDEMLSLQDMPKFIVKHLNR
ncbi:MAG: hypothetical protein A2504_11280 [Bdellovibrionales bacterium RIFOXYD12_FULL_39_22]|nr:MAG: hypothetical protein A2385_09845 [Bdellovibrionales bacterium RIFOXYB1_FULL_39_21]OFZ44291.1 MAG: hypothetical protein A2485_07465 [Bdellovibrionales bacterium RIFOXYC12_FULL_39_17]OFZ46839.1 MAG: hypothetical protein A2404_04700 [Bdellovibrionales bacterium RIFOXYC1_FULL_39_130]OFZ76085.1 MAG: hypothetical protein A2560_02450 [Bdellovibrionales bacterium RIFOXYD1_FULL_39_84]OFZ95513.1 MAG: hypothetical protein A2504_11280 [Bdellovibrionales bacterium RIFOXYD12_FULL_39_22]